MKSGEGWVWGVPRPVLSQWRKRMSRKLKGQNKYGQKNDTRLSFDELCRIAGIDTRQRITIKRYVEKRIKEKRG